MTDDLVKRLRSRTVMVNYGHGDVRDIPDEECEEAADRIEKLEAALRQIKDLHHGTEDKDVSVIDSIFMRDDRTYKIVCDTLEELQ